MARVSVIAVILCCVFIGEYVTGNLIRSVESSDVITKDIPGTRDGDFDGNAVDIPVDAGLEAAVKPEVVTTTKACVAVGKFCMNHSDCCTNSCMGYLKKCV